MTKELLSQKLEKHNAYLGIGGTGWGGNDLDLVYVADKIDFEFIAELKRELVATYKKKVSVQPMTTLMLRCPRLWGSKFATMHLKGMEWMPEAPVIPDFNMDNLRTLAQREAPFFLNLWMKNLASGKSKDKAIELLLQEISLLTE